MTQPETWIVSKDLRLQRVKRTGRILPGWNALTISAEQQRLLDAEKAVKDGEYQAWADEYMSRSQPAGVHVHYDPEPNMPKKQAEPKYFFQSQPRPRSFWKRRPGTYKRRSSI